MTELRQKPISKPILILLPNALIEKLNGAAAVLRLSRSALIRTSLQRDMEYVIQHEVAEARIVDERTAVGYVEWLLSEAFQAQRQTKKSSGKNKCQ